MEVCITDSKKVVGAGVGTRGLNFKHRNEKLWQ